MHMWPPDQIVAWIHENQLRLCIAISSARKVQGSSSRFPSGQESRHGILAFQEISGLKADRSVRRLSFEE
jgi:hypothetical protein